MPSHLGFSETWLSASFRTVPAPPFALERLEASGADRLVYHLPEPSPDGRTDLTLTPFRPRYCIRA